jgi:hypothetical protein
LRKNLASFSIGNIITKLNRIHVDIRSKHNRTFPKLRELWLSEYIYQRRHIKIHPDGRIAGGLSRFVSSLVDFSFIRSIVANRYSILTPAYDPVSLFLAELFRYLEKFPNMKAFVHVLRDPVKGRHYRLYAGFNDRFIPCEGTFTVFKNRLGEPLYNAIFHTLVEIAELLGLISFDILTTDGTLFPTNARYKGCTHFCSDCNAIEIRNIIENVRQRILYRLDDPKRIVLGKEIRIRTDCPSPRFPPDVPRPKVEVFSLCLLEANPDKPSILNQIFGLQKELQKAGLDLVPKRGVITGINLDTNTKTDSFFFRCPRLPADMDARIGVRRNPQNPNRKQKIFGFNAIIDTAIDLELGIELPVACTTIAGNAKEGKHFITNRDQIFEYHEKRSKIDLADAKYDELDNYAYSRSNGAIPIIDYNPRSENLSPPALRERGYDHNGWPYAPCGLLTRPNGFDFNCQRASFSCRRQCVYSKDPAITEFMSKCPHWINYHGFTRHMSIVALPRLITEVPRGTNRHQKLKALRSASERVNSTAKDDFAILVKPKIRGLSSAGALSQMAVIVVLLKRVAKFIIKVTLALRKQLRANRDPPQDQLVSGPEVLPFIRNLILRE